MKRSMRVARLWAWLPAFRAVAEVERLNQAAATLALCPSALSRTIRLLEEEVGAPLFIRSGRNMSLTRLGRELLVATRGAMRLVDDQLGAGASELTGPIRVSTAGRLTTVYVVPALRRLRLRHPALSPHLVCVSPGEIAPQLLQGLLDAAVAHTPIHHDQIGVERLGEVTNGVYCGPGHALYAHPSPAVGDVLAHPFAAPEPHEGGPSADSWPAGITRHIALYSQVLEGGIEPCEEGELLAVFPDELVSTFPRGAALRRLPVDIVPSTALFGMRRTRVGATCAVGEAILDAVRVEVDLRSAHHDATLAPETQQAVEKRDTEDTDGS